MSHSNKVSLEMQWRRKEDDKCAGAQLYSDPVSAVSSYRSVKIAGR